ncbi:hypothetical protein P7C71_g3008, partial [Lecanoromycetidae sp. Uapishka_2]
MNNPNDATIDMPLNKVPSVPSKTGVRRSDTYTPPRSQTRRPTYLQPQTQTEIFNEKAGPPKRPVAGRRHTEDKRGNQRKDGEEDTLTHMGVIYNKILNFSVITRYFLYVLPLAILIAIPIIIGATAAQNAQLGGVRIVWIFSWLECVWLSLWVSKLAAKSLPAVFQFLCGIVSSGTRKYALVIQSLEIYLSLSGWALASLATFVPVMTRNPTQRAQAATYAQNNNSTNAATKNHALLFENATAVKEWESVVQRILAAFLVASLILLAEKLLIQLISISYHRTQFNSKIKDSKHKIYLLSLLYDASRSLFPAYCQEFAEEDYIINDAIDLSALEGKHHSGHTRSGSATPLRLIQNIGRVGDKLTSAFGGLASEITGKQVFNPDSAHSIVVEALEKNKSSEALAKRLWMSFVVEGKEALYLEDIVEVLGADRHAEAEEAFAILDRDSNGDVSLDEMILTVCEFGKDRHSIASSLHDVDQAINVLDNLLCTIVFVVTIFVFDIGDDQLVVKHISLLFTVFKYVKNQKLTQVPNIVLNTQWIQNVSRSEAMREQLLIYVDFGTTLEDIQLLRNEMQAFVQAKDNSRDFQPDIDVEITGIAEMNKMELKVEIRHKSNWSNETVRAARRSKFMCALVLALRKIPINAPGGGGAALGSADQPTYSVAVSDAQAAANRDAFAKAKDEKRLFPASKPDPAPAPKSTTRGAASSNDTPNVDDSLNTTPLRYRLPHSESNVLTTLNSRHPAADTAQNSNDLIEPTTPKSVAYSISGTEPDLDRSASVDEARNVLRRQSTRGKRKASVSSAKNVPPISETTSTYPPPPPSAKIDFDPYSYSSSPQQQQKQQQQQQPSPAAPSKDSPLPMPKFPTPPPSQSQLSAQAQYHITQLQNQQRPPPPTSAPRQAPQILPPGASLVPATATAPQPPPKPLVGTTSLTPEPPMDDRSGTAGVRATSPVRNPFQVSALREQQGRGLPQMRRPVGGNSASGTPSPTQQSQQGEGVAVGPGSVARAVNSGTAVRPPRGDSLRVPNKEEVDTHVGNLVMPGDMGE